MEEFCCGTWRENYSPVTISAISSKSGKRKYSIKNIWWFSIWKIFQYIESVTGWSGSCEVSQVSNDISVLEQNIHHHQSLYEAMCQAYTEVSITRVLTITRVFTNTRVNLVISCSRCIPRARSCCISWIILSSWQMRLQMSLLRRNM